MSFLDKILINMPIRNKILAFNSLSLIVTIAAMLYFIVAANKSIQEVSLQQEILTNQDLVQGIESRFSAVQYWSLDLGVSWLNDSEDMIYENADALRNLLEQLETVQPDLSASLLSGLDQYIEVNLQAVDTYVDENRVKGNSLVSQGRQIGVEMQSNITGLLQQLQIEVGQSNERVITANSNLIIAAIVSLALIIVAGVGSAIALARVIATPLNYAIRIANRIASRNLEEEISTHGSDETGKLLGAMSRMQDDLRAAAEEAKQNSEFRQSLDKATANIMIADINNDIIYVNGAVIEMFREAEAEIQKISPGFDVNNLIGQKLDVFEQDSNQQESLRNSSLSKHTTQIKAGALTFQVIVNAMTDENGDRVSTVLEWQNRTQELVIEQEVQSIVERAMAGDLKQRIKLKGKEGFIATLSACINQLVGTCEEVIDETVSVLSNLSQGDLTSTINGDYQGSFGLLKEHTNATVDKLTEVVRTIVQSSESVATGSLEIYQGNTSLSTRTEEQASSLEETATSMEGLTSTVHQNAENAKEADLLALGAKSKAEHGGNIVAKAVLAMADINDASKRIADIISVIDEIAFQTNLLALNASVEAARAGEQGRGFAVVASEVRNLAGRSATAAKEIKVLIEDSVHKVNEGSKLVNDSGKTLKEIIVAVQKVTDIVAGISRASREQAMGIEEVSKAITQMDDMTQQNAALVEEAAVASESMGDQAKSLKTQMTFFNVGSSS